MTTALNRRQTHLSVESQVEDWLKASGASYLHQLEPSSLGGEIVDFLVIKPFPLAIEVTWMNPRAWRSNAKRILSQRINIARQYGRYTPVVAVISGQGLAHENRDLSLEKKLPFFDAVIDIDAENFPDLREFREHLRLNPLTQKILEEGKPHRYDLTDPEKIPEKWLESQSLEDFVRDEPYGEGTVAEGLRCRLLDFCQLKNIEIKTQKKTLVGIKFFVDNLSSQIRFRLNPIFEDELKNQILQKVGGYFDQSDQMKLRYEDSLYSFGLRSLIWNSPTGKRVAIRYYTISYPHLYHKSKELLADVWMLRALIDDPVDEIILLLSTGGKEPPDAQTINALEANGITVLPWDFAQAEPRFVKYLQVSPDQRLGSLGS